MRGEIICIGDELISGRVRESNAAFAARELAAAGLDLNAVVVVGDLSWAISDALTRAVKRSDFVVVTGGLGATDDDITASVAAETFDLPLTESARMVANLRAFFEACGLPGGPAYQKLAQLPAGAKVLDSQACGFYLETKQKTPVFFLPGVPGQMRRLMREKVLPALLEREPGGARPLSTTLRVFGLPEPELGVLMQGLSSEPGTSVGFYPVFPEVHLVLTARLADQERSAGVLEQMAAEAARRLGRFLAARDETLEARLGRQLSQAGATIATAESCTGGLIGDRITNVPGSSDYFLRGLVVYSNRAKMELLGVKRETLAAHGAVSGQTAAEMATGAQKNANSTYAVAVTGIAGPGGGTPEKPVGTVWFGLAWPGGVSTHQRQFWGGREQVKAQSAETALLLASRRLEEDA